MPLPAGVAVFRPSSRASGCEVLLHSGRVVARPGRYRAGERASVFFILYAPHRKAQLARGPRRSEHTAGRSPGPLACAPLSPEGTFRLKEPLSSGWAVSGFRVSELSPSNGAGPAPPGHTCLPLPQMLLEAKCLLAALHPLGTPVGRVDFPWPPPLKECARTPNLLVINAMTVP